MYISSDEHVLFIRDASNGSGGGIGTGGILGIAFGSAIVIVFAIAGTRMFLRRNRHTAWDLEVDGARMTTGEEVTEIDARRYTMSGLPQSPIVERNSVDRKERRASLSRDSHERRESLSKIENLPKLDYKFEKHESAKSKHDSVGSGKKEGKYEVDSFGRHRPQSLALGVIDALKDEKNDEPGSPAVGSQPGSAKRSSMNASSRPMSMGAFDLSGMRIANINTAKMQRQQERMSAKMERQRAREQRAEERRRAKEILKEQERAALVASIKNKHKHKHHRKHKHREGKEPVEERDSQRSREKRGDREKSSDRERSKDRERSRSRSRSIEPEADEKRRRDKKSEKRDRPPAASSSGSSKSRLAVLTRRPRSISSMASSARRRRRQRTKGDVIREELV